MLNFIQKDILCCVGQFSSFITEKEEIIGLLNLNLTNYFILKLIHNYHTLSLSCTYKYRVTFPQLPELP